MPHSLTRVFSSTVTLLVTTLLLSSTCYAQDGVVNSQKEAEQIRNRIEDTSPTIYKAHRQVIAVTKNTTGTVKPPAKKTTNEFSFSNMAKKIKKSEPITADTRKTEPAPVKKSGFSFGDLAKQIKVKEEISATPNQPENPFAPTGP